jgi:glycosyltransferase involved in cell wall biosynthesis
VQYWHPKKSDWKNWLRLFQSLRPDIIHTQGLWSPKFSIIPLLAAQRYNEAKIVVSPRGVLTSQALNQKRWKKTLMSFVLKTLGAFNNVVFHSTNDKETDEIRLFLRIRSLNSKPFFAFQKVNYSIRQIPNIPRNLGLALRRLLRVKQYHEFHWLFIGRISPEKNPLLLLEALDLLTIPSTGYFIGGYQNETYFSEFQNAINNLPAQHQVKYLGELSVDEIAEYLTQCDLLVNTSISENFGHAMAEALSAGVPILVGPNTPWQQLWEAKAGEVAEYSAQGFAEAMDKFATMDFATHNQFKVGAVKHFAERCELSATKAKYLNLYLFPNP